MRRAIPVLAGLNISLHVLGLAVAAIFIRPGSPLAPLADRREYHTAFPERWQFAWAVWCGCAVAMVAFTIAVGRRIQESLARWAVVVAIAAAAVDLTCDAIFITRLPHLAADTSAVDAFLETERWTGCISLLIANGLYSISTLLLTLALRGRATTIVGIAVFICGMLLAAAGITGVPEHALWATGPTIGLYCVWVLLVARELRKAGL